MYTLNEKLKALRGQEKILLHEILLTIIKVENTKLFLKMAYPSLFEYLVKEIGYCPASAQRRIDSVRLMQQVPELGAKIASGTVSLAQVSKVQQAVRTAKKSGVLVSRETKQSIIKQIEFKSPKQTEQILAEEFSLEIQQVEKVKVQRDDSHRVELTFSSEDMKVLEEVKALLSNSKQGSTSSSSLHDLVMDLATRFVKSRTQLRSPKMKESQEFQSQKVDKELFQEPERKYTDQEARQNQFTGESRVARTIEKNTAPLKISVKKLVLQKQQGCQHFDTNTQRLCGSKYFLQYDHIQERQFGGSNAIENLRLLCGNHHRLRHGK